LKGDSNTYPLKPGGQGGGSADTFIALHSVIVDGHNRIDRRFDKIEERISDLTVKMDDFRKEIRTDVDKHRRWTCNFIWIVIAAVASVFAYLFIKLSTIAAKIGVSL
jgi:hypothetical protein